MGDKLGHFDIPIISNDRFITPGRTNRDFLTCEAGVSIKPGAQAPGTRIKKIIEPAKRAAARGLKTLSPASRARLLFYNCYPGACAPGFMLSLASRALAGTQSSLLSNYTGRVFFGGPRRPNP
jgi:hypothetical protein